MPIIDPLPFTIDRAHLTQVLRVREGSHNAAQVDTMVREAAQVARPRALYRMCFIEARTEDSVIAEGITFTSRILRVNLGDLQRLFAYVITSGSECETWAEGHDDLLFRFYADMINQGVLRSAVAAFAAHIREAYGVPQTSTMNPGSLPDWPLSQQKPLFALLGDVEAQIGVELKPSFLMYPTKTVSGIMFPTEETFASCQLCPRENCPNRRAPYDPGLFERKYRGASEASAAAAAPGDGVISGH